MISKLALAALAAAVSAEDIEAIYPNTLYRRDGGSHSHASSSSSYGAPEPSYSAPSYGYEEASAGLDLTSILIPILALLGLSLLFPTFVTVSGGRRKRDVLDEGKTTDNYSHVTHFR